MKTQRRAAMLMMVAAGAILPMAARANVSAPAFVNSEAVFWLDASTLSQLPGQEVTTWPDVRGEGYPTATTCAEVTPKMTSTSGTRENILGKKAVTFFTAGTQCDMNFSEDYNVKAAFFVVDIDATQDAFLLGGPNTATKGGHNYAFHRNGANYKYGYAPACTYWNDGVQVENPGGTAIPTGYQLISYRYDASGVGGAVQQLTRDRNQSSRVGGRRLCEVITFGRVLTDEERVAVEDYLRAKWFEETWSWTDGLSVNDLLGMAQVHFDASVASSFHYDTEDPTKVVQWDDLSGNNNNFTQNTRAYNPQLGGLSEIRGKPVYDTEGYSSGIDLVLNTRLTTTRTVFMVCDIIANNNVMWLGDASALRFIRGYDNSYFYQYAGEPVYGWSKASIWCNGKQVPTSNQPERAGELSVYVFRVPADCEWQYLGLDRDCDNYKRNGGKRVAELITFAFEVPDEALNKISDHLIEKWTPSEAYIDAMAPVHIDASSADNFNYTGANITGWKNAGLGADLFCYPQGYLDNTAYDMGYGSYGMTNGVPAFLMGRAQSNIDLAFERLTNIRTVFWAMDIQRVAQAFFLGDPRMTAGQGGEYHFHRGGAGQYAGGYDNGFRYGNLACDGTVVNTTGDYPPYGTHVFDLSASKDCTAAAISGDRWCDHRNGGRAISELLILTNEVWGLTRVGVRKRIENKWTKRCGWAGAGDVEWGVDKYRVFGADATVPEGGASAKGVGFTANATLDGDTLTLGEGGIFASEGATVTIDAALAGNMAIHGPGVVRFASAVALPSFYVGFGSNVELPVGSSITGNLTMREGSQFIVDVSSLAAKQYAEISLGTVTLPEGGSFLDYIALSDDSHTLSISSDGTKILVNDNVPVRVIWKGGADVKDAANWTCYDEEGDELGNTLPGRYVTNVTLNAALDLRDWGTPVFGADVIIDLQGNYLYVNNLDGTVWANALITNSVDATTATLDVTVASGTVSDTTATIGGNIKFVKRGSGTFVASRTQGYTGGTEVAGGVLKAGVVGTSNPLGVQGTGLLVGSGATFDINAKSGFDGYSLTLAGGILQNSGGGIGSEAGIFTNVTLTADSQFEMPNNSTWTFAGKNYAPVTLNLDGHKLSVGIYQVNVDLAMCNATVLGGGRIDITRGGNFRFGVKNNAAANNEIIMTNVDLRVSSALRVYAPVSVRNYEAIYTSLDWVGIDSTAELKVYGAFKPSSHDVFYGCTMMNGSKFDLANRTGTGKLPFYLTAAMTGNSASCAHKAVSFANNATVTVDLTPFADRIKTFVQNGDYILTWDAKPADSVKFVPDEATAKRSYVFVKDNTGLKLISAGFTIFVR